VRLAIDIGGTFTDALLYDDQSGHLWGAKVNSTPEEPERAFFNCVDIVLEKAELEIKELKSITHGTTVVTNALLEGKAAKTGLLVTQGFRDLLEIGRQVRPELYDLTRDRLPSLVSRQHILEMQERVDAKGQVLIPLNEAQAAALIKSLAQEGIESLGIALLFSFLAPGHEERLRRLAREHLPEDFIFLSSQVSPEFREYERASTTVVAAAVAPSIVTYLNSIHQKLLGRGWTRDTFSLMHSGGGLLSVNMARRRPHTLIESGPAAGVIATSQLASEVGLERVIAFDMGGTTAKASLILEGQPGYTHEYEVGGGTHRSGRAMGKGYPVRFPMLDLAECGAGAGSLAWIDAGGHLKVGPQSAGADPGPVCYRRGGSQPTLTDVYLALGMLSPVGFLGGEMLLDRAAAKESIQSKIAGPLGLPLQEAASGVMEIADANMLRILRLVSVQRGFDPREFSLVAYGGAGPLHATKLAEQMNIRQVIIPRHPALFSALGLLLANPRMDFAHTVMLTLSTSSLPDLNKAIDRLETEAGEWFEKVAVPTNARRLNLSADLRYLHQNYELSIEIPSGNLNHAGISSLHEIFNAAHEQAYGHCTPGETIQMVNLRMQAIHAIRKPTLLSWKPSKRVDINESRRERRKVWLDGKWQLCSIYKRVDLRGDQRLKGPLIVQERNATVLVRKGWKLSIDQWGNLILVLPG
jgi:N-methylhydantoinase A